MNDISLVAGPATVRLPTLDLSWLWAGLLGCLQPLKEPGAMELRIDVDRPDENIETELEALYGRLYTPGDPVNLCTRLPQLLPGLLFHHREADGEHYVYVEDALRRRLAGYTVFNRLIEVDRRTDRHVRSPHSKYGVDYQGRGIASAVYGWALGCGFCLVSGARQSKGAHALWRSLARRHPLRWIRVQGKRMHDLGPGVSPVCAARLDTRILLLGEGWSLAGLHAQGLLLPGEDLAGVPLPGAVRRRSGLGASAAGSR